MWNGAWKLLILCVRFHVVQQIVFLHKFLGTMFTAVLAVLMNFLMHKQTTSVHQPKKGFRKKRSVFSTPVAQSLHDYLIVHFPAVYALPFQILVFHFFRSSMLTSVLFQFVETGKFHATINAFLLHHQVNALVLLQ